MIEQRIRVKITIENGVSERKPYIARFKRFSRAFALASSDVACQRVLKCLRFGEFKDQLIFVIYCNDDNSQATIFRIAYELAHTGIRLIPESVPL